MEVKSKSVTIQDKEYIFRPNFRAFVDFEDIARKSISEIESLKDSALFLYCGIKSGMKYNKKEFDVEFEDFIDMLDNFDIMSVISDDEDASEKPKEKKK